MNLENQFTLNIEKNYTHKVYAYGFSQKNDMSFMYNLNTYIVWGKGS